MSPHPDCPQLFQRAAQILKAANEFVLDGSNVVWSGYETAADMRAQVAVFIEQFHNQDPGAVAGAALLFAPTGSFQEHAISNGWTKEYMEWASAFDEVAEALKDCC